MNLGALSYSDAREENARFGPAFLSIMNEELSSEEARPIAGLCGHRGAESRPSRSAATR